MGTRTGVNSSRVAAAVAALLWRRAPSKAPRALYRPGGLTLSAVAFRSAGRCWRRCTSAAAPFWAAAARVSRLPAPLRESCDSS